MLTTRGVFQNLSKFEGCRVSTATCVVRRTWSRRGLEPLSSALLSVVRDSPPEHRTPCGRTHTHTLLYCRAAAAALIATPSLACSQATWDQGGQRCKALYVASHFCLSLWWLEKMRGGTTSIPPGYGMPKACGRVIPPRLLAPLEFPAVQTCQFLLMSGVGRFLCQMRLGCSSLVPLEKI